MDELKIFRFLLAALKSGRPCALVSVLATSGPSMRLPGAHMAVTADGEYVGSVSGGCIERAVVAEAQDAIRVCGARLTRFGKGSKYIDIRLPCGGAMDLHFQPWIDERLTDEILGAIERRQPFSLKLGMDETPPSLVGEYSLTHWSEATNFGEVGHWPRPMLLILGQGENVEKLAEVTAAWGADVAIHSPDRRLVADLAEQGFRTLLLGSPADLNAIKSDLWTAIVLLFHDHEWEVPAIEALIDQPHFYFGAMGSRKTHQRRVDHLLGKGIPTARLDAICAPIGLVPGSRDPATLAISIVAEVADYHRQADFSALTAEQ